MSASATADRYAILEEELLIRGRQGTYAPACAWRNDRWESMHASFDELEVRFQLRFVPDREAATLTGSSHP